MSPSDSSPPAAFTATRQVYRYPVWFAALGALCLGFGGLVATVMVWLLWPSSDLRLGQRILMWVCSPLSLTMSGYLLVLGWRGLRRATQRFHVKPEGLQISGWIVRPSFTPWEEIVGASLDADRRFGHPPNMLRLHRVSGRDLTADHWLSDWPGFLAALRAASPVLADLDPESAVDDPQRPPPGLGAVRAEEALFMRVMSPLALLGFLALVAVGALVAARDQWRHWQLESRPDVQTAQATILEITETEDSRHARVAFISQEGQTIRKRRRVPPSFTDAFSVGDTVTVRYLPDQPEVAEIQGYDLAGRSWVQVVIALPMAGLLLICLPGLLASNFGPVRRTAAWRPLDRERHEEARFDVFLGDSRVERTLPAFYDRHHGPTVIVYFKASNGGNANASLEALHALLDKHGVPGRFVARSLLLLNTRAAETFWKRIGGPPSRTKLAYACLDLPEDVSDDDAQAWLTERLDEDGSLRADILGDLRFFNLSQCVGPFCAAELPDAFNRWVGTVVAEAWNGRPPDELRAVDWARQLNLKPHEITDAGGDLLIERARHELRVWFRGPDAPTARLATWSEHGWVVFDGLPLPPALRERRNLPVGCGMILLSPLLLITVPINLIVMVPLKWIERRQRRAAVRKARQARGVLPAAEARGTTTAPSSRSL